MFLAYARLHGGFLLPDWVNLPFHEAGHFFFGFFGATLGLYGGTIGQLVFPVATDVSFARKRNLPAVALSIFWLGENFLNIGWSMADAATQVIPTVGGGPNDWTVILRRWHSLAHDTALGAVTRGVGWAMMLAAVALLGARAYGLDRLRARLRAEPNRTTRKRFPRRD